MMETVKLKPRPCEACSEEDGGKAREIDTLSAAYLKLATATQDTETSKVRLLLIAAIEKMLKGDF